MSGAMKNAIIVLVLAALGVGGAYLYVRYDERMTALSKASLDWPSVDGLITHSNLETRVRKTGGSRRKTEHRVAIYYEYVVDDEVFRNDVVQFNQDNLSTSGKERLVSAYPEGRRVDVFYNPDKPKQSVLVRGSWPQG